MYDSSYIKFKKRSNSSMVIEFQIVVTCRGRGDMGLLIVKRLKKLSRVMEIFSILDRPH